MTCNLKVGAVVPMPTFTPLPSTSELLCVTWALAPMAVALLSPAETRVEAPSRVLLAPAVLVAVKSASSPMKVLPKPVVLREPVLFPKKAFNWPVVLPTPAW